MIWLLYCHIFVLYFADGVWRQSVAEMPFPVIPVQTISCDTAHRLLQRMSGHVAPSQWQGNYNETVYMGRKSKSELD